jgi:FemAB-related protein (PEP-CTERM system-associated)
MEKSTASTADRVEVLTDLSEIDGVADSSQWLDAAYDPRWLGIVCRGMNHQPYLLAARSEGKIVGLLPLAFVKSLLFGRFLVGLPYVNTAGVIARDGDVAHRLIDQAVRLADDLKVRHLELRHEGAIDHAKLTARLTTKVHMRMALPDTVVALQEQLRSKTRNKVRKGEQQGFTEHWGRHDLLDDFYAVFSQNMRDLGTPVFGRKLFRAILDGLPEQTEFCVIRSGSEPIAAALLVHGRRSTQVPSASSLRAYNSTNANDWMYWRLLVRAVERGQRVFDFGRSTIDSNTYVFKKKWGAEPEPAVWQYYVREGDPTQMRPENSKYQRAIRLWQKLPAPVTRVLGPMIVRGIP